MSLNQGNILRGEVQGKGNPTPLDISNIGDLSDQELREYIENHLLPNNTSFDTINRIYDKTLLYLEEELFYNSNDLNRFRSVRFSSIDDIISFLKQTKRPRGILYCVIAKLFQIFQDVDEEFNKKIRNVKEKTTGVIEGKLLQRMKINKTDGDKLVGESFFEVEKGVYKKIPFIIKKRLKSTYSTVSKELRDPEYFIAERISDWYGATVEVKNKDDILPLMQMIAAYVFKKSDFQVKNDKGMFTHTEIIANNKVSDEFLEKVLQGTIERDKPESGDVVDIKLVTPKDKGDEISNLSLEIKFIVSENQNENGLNMHGIYGYMKKINERIRLEGYVTPDYISLVADKFIKNLDFILISNTGRPEEEGDSSDKYKTELFQDLRGQAYISKELDLRNPHIKAHIDDHLKQGIINYFKSRLLLVHKKGSKKPHYSNKRALLMSERGISVELTSGVL